MKELSKTIKAILEGMRQALEILKAHQGRMDAMEKRLKMLEDRCYRQSEEKLQ